MTVAGAPNHARYGDTRGHERAKKALDTWMNMAFHPAEVVCSICCYFLISHSYTEWATNSLWYKQSHGWSNSSSKTSKTSCATWMYGCINHSNWDASSPSWGFVFSLDPKLHRRMSETTHGTCSKAVVSCNPIEGSIRKSCVMGETQSGFLHVSKG